MRQDVILSMGDREIRLSFQEQAVLFFRRTPLGMERYARFSLPPEFQDMEFYDLYMEGGHPLAILVGRSFYDIAVILDEETGQMIRWHLSK